MGPRSKNGRYGRDNDKAKPVCVLCAASNLRERSKEPGCGLFHDESVGSELPNHEVDAVPSFD
jgi:hypothetical protein